MLKFKVTIGYVIQMYDVQQQRFLSQEFIQSNDDVAWQDVNGDATDEEDAEFPITLTQPEGE